jgi:hypothetical protein
VSFKRRIKNVINIFRLNRVLKDRIGILEESAALRRDIILGLEEENTRLRDTVVSSVDLVQNYKTGMLQMKQYLNQVIISQSGEDIGEDSFDENEEEGELDEYKAFRKKTTIH